MKLLLEEPLQGTRIAYQEHGDEPGSALEPLTDAGAEVIRVPIYRWIVPDDVAPALRLIDAALLFGQLRLDQGLRLTIRRQGKTLEVTMPAEVFKDFAGPTVRALGKEQYEVLFRCKPAGMVKTVALAGTFNDWNPKAKQLEGPDKDGYFSGRLVLKPGTYEYKFLLDGKTWMADPDNFRTTGSDGNSVLTVGESR